MDNTARSRETNIGEVSSSPALEVRDLWASYDSQPVLEGVNFTLQQGWLAGLVGPNGCGKSTLLRVVLGLHRADRGGVYVFGKENAQVRRRLGYMPQSELVDWSFPVTVFDVVMMGRYGRLGLLRRPGRHDRDVVWRCLGQVGMEKLANRQIGELSGGQQRRALIARALAQEPDLLLLDEPTTGLDAVAQHDLLELMEQLRDQGTTLLVATHDLACVASCFDQAILLNRQVVAQGHPSEVFTEDKLRAAFQHHIISILGRPYVDIH